MAGDNTVSLHYQTPSQSMSLTNKEVAKYEFHCGISSNSTPPNSVNVINQYGSSQGIPLWHFIKQFVSK